MPKVRTKTAILEAFQVGSSPIYPDWLRDAITKNIVVTHAPRAPKAAAWGDAFDHADVMGYMRISRAERLDWIIRGGDGELHVCDSWIFPALFEAVPDA